MIIKHTSFGVGVHYIEMDRNASEIGLDEEYKGNIHLNCKMDKSPGQIILDCNIEAEAEFNCDRCTESIEEIIETSFVLTYIFDSEEESDNSDLKFLSPDDDKIDLTEDIRDFLEVALPMKHLCSDDCKGLCYKCGTNLNYKQCDCKDDEINPVWEPLLELKKKLNKKEQE